MRAGSPVAHALLERVEGDVTRLTGPLVTEAARAGDPLAVEMFTDIGTWLGVGLAGMTAAFDPSAIVVGGGVSAAGDLLLGPARQAFSRTLTGRGHRPEPPIMQAALGASAGFIGAADMARSAARRSRRRRRRRDRPGRPLFPR
jgi:glucokinase